MNLFYNHPYLTGLALIFLINMVIKWITRASRSPLTQLLFLITAGISQACSPFAGPVDKEKSDSYYYSKGKKYIQYSPMGNWFSLGNTRLNADVESFQVIARAFGRDKSHVFYQAHCIDDEIEQESFSVKGFICFDKNQVYKPSNGFEVDGKERFLRCIRGADPKTYIEIDSDWAKDHKAYFYNDTLIDADYATFEILNSHFAKDHEVVHVLSRPPKKEPLIDAQTTRKIDDRYIADNTYIYDFKEYVEGKKVDLLIKIPYQNRAEISIDRDYLLLKASNKVYYDAKEIEGIDLPSFTLFSAPQYCRDHKHVYYDGEIIPEADPNSFEIMEYTIYAKDKAHVFHSGKVLPGADAATFAPVDDNFSLKYKDKNHTYVGGEIDN